MEVKNAFRNDVWKELEVEHNRKRKSETTTSIGVIAKSLSLKADSEFAFSLSRITNANLAGIHKLGRWSRRGVLNVREINT